MGKEAMSSCWHVCFSAPIVSQNLVCGVCYEWEMMLALGKSYILQRWSVFLVGVPAHNTILAVWNTKAKQKTITKTKQKTKTKQNTKIYWAILSIWEEWKGKRERVGTRLTIVTFKRSLIIDDKSLPHKLWRSFTRLLIFKIKLSSERSLRLNFRARVLLDD